jgi:putative hemolysin
MSSGLTLFLLASIVCLGVASAFFSAAETALFSLRGPQIEAVKASRPRDGALIAEFLARPRRLLGMLLVADVLVTLPLCLLCLLLFEGQVPAVFSRELPRWAAAPVLFAIVIGACDLIPKLLALKRPEPIARQAVGVLRWLSPALVPVGDALVRVVEWLADMLTPRRWSGANQATAEELEMLAELASEAGTLRGSEGPIIGELIKLGEKTAKDCMTPRVDAFALPDDLTSDEVATRLRSGRHRFVPIYAETPDDILGVLDARGFLLNPNGADYLERLLPPSFVPETMAAIQLLRSFLTHRQGMAVVVDEYGGYEGIVTPADLAEEILADAMPGGAEGPTVEHQADGTLLASGQARLDDLAEFLGVPLETDGLDTLGGLIINRLGYIPKAGTTLDLGDGLQLTIQRATRRRVESVIIEKGAPHP